MTVDLHQPLPADLSEAADRVAATFGPGARVAVAFSGGVDSSTVLALAARAVGRDGVVAVLGVSPSLAAEERTAAQRTAADLGVRLVEVDTYEINEPGYVANAGDRCYFCKHELYTRSFAEVVTREGADVLVNGDTADDAVRTDRSGRRAAEELGVRSPLAEAGVGKATVRRLARALGLATWDKPSAPCLASRIPVHTPVTIGDLSRVERAETRLRSLGLRDLRVRHLGGLARLELADEGHDALRDSTFADAVRDSVLSSGYDQLEIAPQPLRRD
jgi:pyridinium-3,5-biscarboxylic acid mononucleotide sulfurtransferase